MMGARRLHPVYSAVQDAALAWACSEEQAAAQALAITSKLAHLGLISEGTWRGDHYLLDAEPGQPARLELSEPVKEGT